MCVKPSVFSVFILPEGVSHLIRDGNGSARVAVEMAQERGRGGAVQETASRGKQSLSLEGVWWRKVTFTPHFLQWCAGPEPEEIWLFPTLCYLLSPSSLSLSLTLSLSGSLPLSRSLFSLPLHSLFLSFSLISFSLSLSLFSSL